MHSDHKYIIFLQKHDSKGIDEIYRLYSGKVSSMISANSGSAEEAADIFQESLIDIYKMSLRKDFRLTCSFEAFIIIICKRKWLNTLKSVYKKKVTSMDEDVYTQKEHDISGMEEYMLAAEKEKTIMEILMQLGNKCKEIIIACIKEKNQEIIAQKLGISYGYLRKRKSLCMAELSKMVKAHHLFKH